MLVSHAVPRTVGQPVHADALLCSVRTAVHATEPDRAADAAEHVIHLLRLPVHRIADAYAASWPAGSARLADLVHEGMQAVLAAMPQAPTSGRGAAVAFFSATVFRALHERWADAKAAHDANEVPLRHAAPLTRVLRALPHEDAALLRLRSEGATWGRLAALLGTSRTTVRRRYDQALRRARDVAGTVTRHAA